MLDLSLDQVAYNEVCHKFYVDQDKTKPRRGSILRVQTDGSRSGIEDLPSVSHDSCFKNVRDIYKYFCSKYKYATILNYDCDLQNDKIGCMQIAAIMPLNEYILQDKKMKGLINNGVIEEKKQRDLLKRLSNFDSRDYKYLFYLPNFLDHNIGRTNPVEVAHYVARLDTVVSLKISEDNRDLEGYLENYRINQPYRAKLGERYSRLFSDVSVESPCEILFRNKPTQLTPATGTEN